MAGHRRFKARFLRAIPPGLFKEFWHCTDGGRPRARCVGSHRPRPRPPRRHASAEASRKLREAFAKPSIFTTRAHPQCGQVSNVAKSPMWAGRVTWSSSRTLRSVFASGQYREMVFAHDLGMMPVLHHSLPGPELSHVVAHSGCFRGFIALPSSSSPPPKES